MTKPETPSLVSRAIAIGLGALLLLWGESHLRGGIAGRSDPLFFEGDVAPTDVLQPWQRIALGTCASIFGIRMICRELGIVGPRRGK